MTEIENALKDVTHVIRDHNSWKYNFNKTQCYWYIGFCMLYVGCSLIVLGILFINIYYGVCTLWYGIFASISGILIFTGGLLALFDYIRLSKEKEDIFLKLL